MREPRACRRLAAAALVASSFFLSPAPCLAQARVDHLEDASLPPRGLLRIRGITAWTRYDARFTPAGTAPLGAAFTSDSLGPRQIPALAGIQSLVQAAAAQPFALTLGRSRLDATAREEIIPIGLEYGLTRRLAVSLVAPIVRRRVATLMRLDTSGVGANVGPNPARTSTAASQRNALVLNEFADAAAQLQARLQACQSNPSAAGCANLLARQTEAQQLIQSSRSFASVLADLYGGGASNGAAFVPIAGSASQLAIAGRISTFNAQYRDFLGTTADVLQSTPVGAGGPAGVAEFTRFAVGESGSRDSLGTQERLLFGDLEIGLKALLVDRPPATGRRVSLLLALASAVRLPTGSTQRANQIVDLSSGAGAVVVDARALGDAQWSRFGLFAAAAYAASVRRTDMSTATTGNSRWMSLRLEPRWHVSQPLALFGSYTLRSTDKLGGDRLVGGGVSYSTLAGYSDGARALPIEMRFTHLEAVSGDPGRPKFFRDQIELRIYLRLLR